MAARVQHTKKNTYRTASNVTRKLRTPGKIKFKIHLKNTKYNTIKNK